MFTPFSKKIIFYDTEFTGFDVNRGELMSMGMVDMNDRELYLEFEYNAEPSQWVKENVIPKLFGKKTTNKKAIEKINKFIGNDKPYAISYVNQFDIAYFYKLIPHEDSPFHWIPIDLASMLFAKNQDPTMLAHSNLDRICKKLDINLNEYQSHNALDDARLYKAIYLKLLETDENNI